MCKFLKKGLEPGPYFAGLFDTLRKTPLASPSVRLSASFNKAFEPNPFWQVKIGGFSGVPILYIDYHDVKDIFSKDDFSSNKFGLNLIAGVRYSSTQAAFRMASSLAKTLKTLTR